MIPTPQYPDRREILLEDKPLLDEAFRQLQPRISEFTFSNIYLFRSAHRYQLSFIDSGIVIFGRGYDDVPYFLPPLSGDRQHISCRLLEDGLTLYGADDRMALTLGDNPGLVITEDRDNFDYLYLKSELASLPGNRFHNKKNRINYFTGRHEYRTEVYKSEFLQGCVALLDKWLRVKEALSSSLNPEADATREALELAGPLGLQGVVILVEGEVKAFVLGERLNRDTAVCHFEKSDPFLEGLPQLVDREFNRLLFTDCTYVNREQDLGEPGLRGAKLSYKPLELVRKYRVHRK